MNYAYIISDAPEYDYRPVLDADPECLGELMFSPDEDSKLNRAANRGKALQADVLAGGEVGAVAIHELRKIGLTLWQRERRAVRDGRGNELQA